MPTEKNIKAVEELKEFLRGASIVISTNYAGLPVSQMTALRRTLRQSGVSYKVVKNTLTYLAADAIDQSEIKGIMQGPVGLALGYGEPTESAKAISDFIRTNRSGLKIIGGVMDGRALSASQVEQLASLPPKDQLIAQLLGQMQGPIAGLANVLNGPIAGLARVLQGHADQMQAQPAE